jgi:hypothetical protein
MAAKRGEATMGRIFPIIALAGLLAGCVTAQDRMAQDDQKCLSYGVAKGSKPYVDCRMELDRQRSNERMTLMSGGTVVVGR